MYSVTSFEDIGDDNLLLSDNEFDNRLIFLSTSDLFGKVSVQGSTLPQSITNPTKRELIQRKKGELIDIYKKLNIDNTAVLEIGMDIIYACLDLNILDIQIAYTGNGEILIYRKINENYHNLIIDINGDVEFLYIPFDRSKTFNQYFDFVNEINTFNLASLLKKV
ncbi:MAG: hypothetical protein LH473_07655 [Chitinophagales bacterium]|nr:hypothetical protein [Chitinophagales bacterium]